MRRSNVKHAAHQYHRPYAAKGSLPHLEFCTFSSHPPKSAKRLWAKIPHAYRQHATFSTDQDVVYEGVIPAAQHRAISKLARKTNHIEHFNNTLRQRVSRLVREALSFSRKLANHIGAIKLFICHYNLTRAAA